MFCLLSVCAFTLLFVLYEYVVKTFISLTIMCTQASLLLTNLSVLSLTVLGTSNTSSGILSIQYAIYSTLRVSYQSCRGEAAGKGIKLAAHYSRFFDLRNEFIQLHKNAAHVTGLQGMLNCIFQPFLTNELLTPVRSWTHHGGKTPLWNIRLYEH